MSGDRSTDASAAEDDVQAQLERDLRMARREIKWVRTEQEHLSEALQRVRRQRARLREQSEALANALAVELSAAYWRDRESARGLLRRRDPEADFVRELEAHPLFEAGWYLRQHQVVILGERLSPALHHVRYANHKRLDPSEAFSTGRYLLRHPESADSGLPALLHAERHRLLDDGTVAVDTTDD